MKDHRKIDCNNPYERSIVIILMKDHRKIDCNNPYERSIVIILMKDHSHKNDVETKSSGMSKCLTTVCNEII